MEHRRIPTLDNRASALDHTRVTDFSIERILSPELGSSRSSQERTPGPCCPGPCCVAPGSLGLYLPFLFYPPYSVMPRAQTWDSCSCLFTECALPERERCHEGVRVQTQQWKSRVRTVFTDIQLQKLEALFERTRYPTPDARAEVARSIGLSEDTVRIWFKNHRARRKTGPAPKSACA